MSHAEYQFNAVKTRILVAPLDWGLGHATRCIPLIRELCSNGCDVWLAGDGAREALLRNEFPQLPFLPLEGYRIQYAKTKAGMTWKIIAQLPSIFSHAKKENKWLKKMVEEHNFHAVISDNRFGLYHKKIPCIFITHQLAIKTPFGKWSEKILQKLNYHYINKFAACWVPDVQGEKNLAGSLSHPSFKPKIPVQYIGLLSRFTRGNTPSVNKHLLVILSGPEPQRTIFENKIVQEIAHYPGTATIVRGLPTALSVLPSTNMIKFYNHLPAQELNAEMEKAEWVIGRCGYSSIMDIVTLQKKSILVPTPGQTEQEYLARHLTQNKMAYCIDQKNFSLTITLENAKQFNYQVPTFDNELKQVIERFILP